MAIDVGDKYLKAWLMFNRSPTDDAKANPWTTYGNPTIGTANAINGNALQLDGQSYIKLSGIVLGGQDFCIDGWVYVDPASPPYARIFSIINPGNGYRLLSFYKNSDDSTKLAYWHNAYNDLSQNKGYSYFETTNSVGSRVYFKFCYQYNNGKFFLYINDRLAVEPAVSLRYYYPRQPYDIYIGTNPDGTQGLIGAIDELRIYDGKLLPYESGVAIPTAADYSGDIYFNADVKTVIHNAPLEWRYENPGTADLLTTSGTTVTGLTPSQSKTGQAFYQTERAKCFDIPSAKEIWIKCDVYCNLTNRWRIYDGNRINGICSQTNKDLNFWANNNNVKTYSNTVKENQLQTVLLHMVSDSDAGIVEAWLDGTKLYTYTGNVNNGDAFADIYLQSDGAGTFFSNVIISNVPLDIDDDVDLHTYLNIDLARNIATAVNATIDTSRSLVTTQTVNADTSRNTAVPASLHADSVRNVSNTLNANFDTARKIANAVNVNLDTARELASGFKAWLDFRADSLRTLSNVVTGFIDTARNITGAITFSADTSRLISKPCNVSADTLRIVTDPNVWRYKNYGTASLLSAEGTTVENLDKSQAIYKTAFYQTERAKCFDIPSAKEIWIKCDVYCNLTDRWRVYNGGANGSTGLTSQTSGEASLFANETNVQQFSSDTIKKNQLQTVLLHMVSDSDAGIVEAWLDGVKLYTYTGNVNNGDAFADIYLQSDGSGTFFSNVIISPYEIGLNENTTVTTDLHCDLVRFFPTTCLVSFDTARNVLWQENLQVDTYRFVTYSVLINADIFCTVNYEVLLDLDAIRTLPHNFILSPVEDFGGVPDTSNDAKALTQSIEIRLNEQSLTDEVVIVTVKPVDIMEQVKGQYLDYKYNMRVETCKQRGILNTCSCCSDIDEILFKQLEYTIPEEEYWRYVNYDALKERQPGITSYIDRHAIPPLEDEEEEDPFALASTHISTIANILGKTPILRFEDFISTVDITAGGTTYNDLIRSIFGWTSRIPQHMINCYLSDDKLFVVQRGHEENVINLSYLQGVDIVGTDYELVRTMWGSSAWSKTETREVLGYTWWKTHFKSLPEPSHGTATKSKHDYYGEGENNEGLVKRTVTQEGNARTTTEYEYTTLSRGRKVLSKETAYVEELIDGLWTLIDTRITEHEYLKNTTQSYSHAYSADDDGNKEPLGNVVSHSNGDSRITPMDYYTATRDENGNLSTEDYHEKVSEYLQQQRTLHGVTLFDTSFPVHGDDSLIDITNAIKWLNRRVMETVTFNIFDYPHVFDFNDRFVLNGKTYFLKSNSAIKTTRIVNKQTVSMVRWY